MGTDERGLEQLSRSARPEAARGAATGAAEGGQELRFARSARFVLSTGNLSGEMIKFPPPVARQIERVLRLRPGQVVTVVLPDGGSADQMAGEEYAVKLEVVSASAVCGRVLGPVDRFTEPFLSVYLLQALLRGDRTELVVQKATELGVAAIVPAVTVRTVVRLSPATAGDRQPRWQRIAQEAAEQSLRLRVPPVYPPAPFPEALRAAREKWPGSELVMLWEGEREVGLTDLFPPGPGGLERHPGVMLLLGPEGGWDPAEVELVRSMGGKTASLGMRTLRAETAALVAVTLVLAAAGDIGR